MPQRLPTPSQVCFPGARCPTSLNMSNFDVPSGDMAITVSDPFAMSILDQRFVSTQRARATIQRITLP